jgi:hypothetical protein
VLRLTAASLSDLIVPTHFSAQNFLARVPLFVFSVVRPVFILHRPDFSAHAPAHQDLHLPRSQSALKVFLFIAMLAPSGPVPLLDLISQLTDLQPKWFCCSLSLVYFRPRSHRVSTSFQLSCSCCS